MTAGVVSRRRSYISPGPVTRASLSSGKAAWIGSGKFPEEKRPAIGVTPVAAANFSTDCWPVSLEGLDTDISLVSRCEQQWLELPVEVAFLGSPWGKEAPHTFLLDEQCIGSRVGAT